MYNKICLQVNASAEYIANLTRNNGITIYNLKSKESGCIFFIERKPFTVLTLILEQQNKQYKVESDKTFKNFFNKNIFRWGIYCGIVIVAFVLYYYSISINRIIISGNNIVETKLIEETITKVITLPIKKNEIVRHTVIAELVSLEGISNASVEIKGNTVIVKVYEELPKVPVIDPTDFSDVLSNFDAVVTKVSVYSGRAVVEEGKAVKKGAPLIVSDLNSGGAKEKAFGQIYGRVWFTKSLVIEPTIMVKRRTGRTETSFMIFGNKDKIYDGEFVTYEYSDEYIYLQNILPLRILKRTYYEIEDVLIDSDYDGNRQGIIKEQTMLIEQELPENSKKLKHWFVEKRLDKTVYLVIYYEIETIISGAG